MSVLVGNFSYVYVQNKGRNRSSRLLCLLHIGGILLYEACGMAAAEGKSGSIAASCLLISPPRENGREDSKEKRQN